MIRNLKALGLALVAIFAMSAMAASAASAQDVTADGEFTIDGVEVGEASENSLTSFGGETRCPGSTYTGHAYDKTPHELLPAHTSTVTLTPHYAQEDCVSVLGESEFSSTVEMTSCDYDLHLVPDSDQVDAYITCDDEGDEIHVTQFAGQSHGFRVCSVTIPAQGPLPGGTITDEGNGHLRLKGTFTGIEASRSGLCGAAEETEGEFHVNATVSGTDDEGNDTDLSITE